MYVSNLKKMYVRSEHILTFVRVSVGICLISYGCKHYLETKLTGFKEFYHGIHRNTCSEDQSQCKEFLNNEGHNGDQFLNWNLS